MKKEYFILEFLKSGPVLLLLVLALLIFIGVAISNHKKNTVQMKEDVIYIAPKPKN